MDVKQIAFNEYGIVFDNDEITTIDAYCEANAVEPVRIVERIIADGLKLFRSFDLTGC